MINERLMQTNLQHNKTCGIRSIARVILKHIPERFSASSILCKNLKHSRRFLILATDLSSDFLCTSREPRMTTFDFQVC